MADGVQEISTENPAQGKEGQQEENVNVNQNQNDVAETALPQEKDEGNVADETGSVVPGETEGDVVGQNVSATGNGETAPPQVGALGSASAENEETKVPQIVEGETETGEEQTGGDRGVEQDEGEEKMQPQVEKTVPVESGDKALGDSQATDAKGETDEDVRKREDVGDAVKSGEQTQAGEETEAREQTETGGEIRGGEQMEAGGERQAGEQTVAGGETQDGKQIEAGGEIQAGGADVQKETAASPQQDEERPKSSSSHGSKRRSPPAGGSEKAESIKLSSSVPEAESEKQTDYQIIPDAPHLLTPERTDTVIEGTVSSSALNIVWSFGLNRNVPVVNLTDGVRKVIMYACAHVGVLYDFHNNRQHILQGHANPIICCCVSEDKRWLVTGDKGSDAMVIVWDTYTGVPIQTLFDPNPEGGVAAVALTPDARYLATLSAARTQTLAIWDWTIDGEIPVCTAELKPGYGVQSYIYFNPEDIHYLVTNSDSQVIFYHWEDRMMEFYAPPLTDEDFNKAVGRYSQSIFQTNSSRALTATSIGNLVVWDNNKPLTKVVSTEQSADKKALKIIRLQDRGINVLTTTDKYIVVGDVAGHVKFFDQSLKLIYWYQEFHLGPITAISFAFVPEFVPLASEGTNYPPDATILAKRFVIRDFVVGSSIAVFGNITADGTKVEVIHREHDAAVHALAAHPSRPCLAIGSYSGLFKIWDYEKKEVLVSRIFERGNHIRCCSYDPNGGVIAVGFTNGTVRVLDSITLDDELAEPFRYARDAITHIAFSHDCQYLATADAEYTVSVFKKLNGMNSEPYSHLGRYRAHYKPIKDILFGVHLDSSSARLVSLGEDRVIVEYDLENSVQDGLKLASSDRIEQSAVPMCMAWYPPITKEHFIVTANDQLKFKLYNTTTKMCRKTLLGPTYGSPLQKILIIPTKNEIKDTRYLAYVTEDKVGLHILPLDGNPHNSMALIAHPSGVANLSCSFDGRYLFTAGGTDAAVHMWEINTNALEAQAKLGGEGLVPFYGLLDGGRDGELFAELEDYFYYAQIRSQSVNAMENRTVSTKIQLPQVPYVMRAMGFYPSEQEIEDMLNEVKFSKYVETGEYVEEIDLGDFIKLYVNHRPAFGLSPEKLLMAFETLGIPTDKGAIIERGELLDLLQSKGEHMTEYELAEYLTTLMGFNAEGGSSELHEFDAGKAGDFIDQNLPFTVSADMFSNEILGFSMYGDVNSARQTQ